MANPESKTSHPNENHEFTTLDGHVRQAWTTGKFSDGSPVQLSTGSDEQGFVVDSNGIFPVDANSRGVEVCSDGREIEWMSFDLSVFKGTAGGHTHPKGLEQKPGPRDSKIAKTTYESGNLSYVLAHDGVYSVRWTGETFVITTIAGKVLSEKTHKKLIKDWLKSKPRTSFKSRADYICQ